LFRSLADYFTYYFYIIGDSDDGTNLHPKITQFAAEIMGVLVFNFA
jgi:hypothetical protein